jgi:hypothetical protein
MYCLSAGPSTILEGSANRVGEPSAVGGGIKVFFTGTIYDDATFEQGARHPDCFQHDQIVESELRKDDGPRPSFETTRTSFTSPRLVVQNLMTN